MSELYTPTIIATVAIIATLFGCGYGFYWRDSYGDLGIIFKRFVWGIVLFFVASGIVLFGYNRYVENVVMHDTVMLRYKMAIEGSTQHQNFARTFYEKKTEEQQQILYDIANNMNLERAQYGVKHRIGFSNVMPDLFGAFMDSLQALKFLPLLIPAVFAIIFCVAVNIRKSLYLGYVATVKQLKDEEKSLNEKILELNKIIKDREIAVNSRDSRLDEVEQLHKKISELKTAVSTAESNLSSITKDYEDKRLIVRKFDKEIEEQKRLIASNDKELEKQKDEISIMNGVIEKKRTEKAHTIRKRAVSTDVINKFVNNKGFSR